MTIGSATSAQEDNALHLASYRKLLDWMHSRSLERASSRSGRIGFRDGLIRVGTRIGFAERAPFADSVGVAADDGCGVLRKERVVSSATLRPR